MARCHACNSELPEGVPVARRNVQAGYSESRWRWGTSRDYYSLRPFCASCAATLDFARLRWTIIRWTFWALLLGGGFYWLTHPHHEPASWPPPAPPGGAHHHHSGHR